VFTTPIGQPLHPSNVTHAFQSTLSRLGLPRQRFHDLRHCCASLMLAQDLSLKDVMETGSLPDLAHRKSVWPSLRRAAP